MWSGGNSCVTIKPMLTVGSLFSGIGGLDLGLERAGMRVQWQCEKNSHCRRVLRRHWTMSWIFKDVTTILSDPQFESLPKVDLICGGDPCQENSKARCNGSCSQRSLGQEFIEIVRCVRPNLVLRENPSVVRKDAPWPWFRFRSELENLGYGVVPFRLRSCCVGGEHRRERLFLFGSLQDANGDRLQTYAKRTKLDKKAVGGESRSIAGSDRGRTPPRILGRSYGTAENMERIKALGNMVDVRQSTFVGEVIMEWAYRVGYVPVHG